MGDSKNSSSDSRKRRQSDQVRLESWKAIASYLNRSVRTVRRWEVSEGLPVFRHQHNKGHSVQAFCSDLDSWRLEHAKASSQSSASAGLLDSTASVEDVRKRPYAQLGRNIIFIFIAAFIGGIVARLVPLDQPSAGIETSPAQANQADLSALPVSKLDDMTYWSESVARTVLLPVLSAWVEGRVEDVMHESQKISERLPNFSPETQGYIVEHLIDISLAIGRVDDARGYLAILTDRNRRYELQTRILFALGDKAGMRAHLQHGAGFEIESTALFMAMAGLVDDAIELESMVGSAESRSRRTNVILATAAMEAGENKAAKFQLQDATSVLDASDSGYYFVALEMLSAVLRLEGKPEAAIDVLEKTMPQREAAAFNKSGLFWLMCQRQLASQYREAGRERDAVRLENELRDVLMFSDKGFPILQSLTDA